MNNEVWPVHLFFPGVWLDWPGSHIIYLNGSEVWEEGEQFVKVTLTAQTLHFRCIEIKKSYLYLFEPLPFLVQEKL